MSKIRLVFSIMFALAVMLIAPIVYERIVWGGLIPNTAPERIDFRGRRYYPSGVVGVEETELKLLKPNFYWNKDLYVAKSSYNDIDIKHNGSVHMMLIIRDSEGQYLGYTISGGP